MMDRTCSANENNLLHIPVYFSLSLAELSVTAPFYTKDFEAFFFLSDPKARPRGLILCCAIQYTTRCCCLLCRCVADFKVLILFDSLTGDLASRHTVQNKQWCIV